MARVLVSAPPGAVKSYPGYTQVSPSTLTGAHNITSLPIMEDSNVQRRKRQMEDDTAREKAKQAISAAKKRILDKEESDDEDEDDDDEEDATRARNERRKANLDKMRNFLWPMIFSVLLEVVFVALMIRWTKGNLHDSPLDEVDALALMFQDEKLLAAEFWAIFGGCVVGRIVIISAWIMDTRGRCPGRIYSLIFMALSTMQWLFYLAAYYWIYDHLTYVVRTYAVALDFESAAAVGGEFNQAYKACMETSFHNHTACTFVMGGVCKKEFSKNATNCFGEVRVGATPCCVSVKQKLSVPSLHLALLGIDWDIDTFFGLLKWLAVLALSWVLLDNPILRDHTAYHDFTSGVWLDILDAVVFSAYILDKKVRNPAYGIAPDGGPAARNQYMMLLLWRCWVLSFATAMLSPLVFLLFFPTSMQKEKDSEDAPVTLETATVQLMDHVRRLDRTKAREVLDIVLELQQESYVQASSRSHPVFVEDLEDPHAEEKSEQGILTFIDSINETWKGDSHRRGMATRKDGARYDVKYSDGLEPTEENVSIDRLEPSQEASQSWFGHGCIAGWCNFRYLKRQPEADETHAEVYQRQASFVDALRSLMFLEAPYLLWRVYFEWSGLTLTSSAVIFMAKNFLWGIHDLMIILACGSDGAVVFHRNPVKEFTAFLNGSAVSTIFVGPAGVFSLAAKFGNKALASRLEQERDRMVIFRTWLMVERAQVLEWDKTALNVYTEQIEEISGKIDDIEMAIKLAHT